VRETVPACSGFEFVVDPPQRSQTLLRRARLCLETAPPFVKFTSSAPQLGLRAPCSPGPVDAVVPDFKGNEMLL
jgi:hypothetical protein